MNGNINEKNCVCLIVLFNTIRNVYMYYYFSKKISFEKVSQYCNYNLKS